MFRAHTMTRLNTLMDEYVPHRIPAVVLDVWRADGRAALHTWGVIDPCVPGSPVTPETWFDLASVAKVFVTTALLMLVGQGRAALDDPVTSLIPEFGGRPRAIDGGQDPHTKQPLPTSAALLGQQVDPHGVTLRHLLTHTSGLAPWRDIYRAAGPIPAAPDQPEPVDRVVRWQRALAALCDVPFVSTVDGIVRYSDLGLMLVGECVSRLTGQPLDAALHTLLRPHFDTMPVYNPMRDHGIPREQIAPTEDDPEWRGRRVRGEVHDENACGIGGVSGHAGLFAPVHTVSQLGHHWLMGTLPIPQELQQMAVTPQAVTGGERRGLGWMIRSLQGSSAGDRLSVQTYGHTGFVGTSLFIDPVNGCVITLLTNAVYYGRDAMPSHLFRRAVHDLVAEDILS